MPQVRSGGTGGSGPFTGEVRFDDVRFEIGRGARSLSEPVSLSLADGGCLAIVGPAGSGKSRIARMILGLESPAAGTIRIGGVPLEGQDVVRHRQRCGVVFQDLSLVQGTIRDNIALADPDAEPESVRAAAAVAAIDDEILSLPMGYETFLSRNGANLSGGQQQRIAIARAVLRRPRILVLDGATTQLDAATEAAVMRNLAALGCTRVVVASRAGAVRDADWIVALDGSGGVEFGTETALLERGGWYRRNFEEGANRPPAAAEAGPGGVRPGTSITA
jgi:ABC-type bacteriocin/lantibiotic exporter with double-glycine peptidase domain